MTHSLATNYGRLGVEHSTPSMRRIRSLLRPLWGARQRLVMTATDKREFVKEAPRLLWG